MNIYQFEASGDKTALGALMKEYLVWVIDMMRSEYGYDISEAIIDSVIENDLQTIEKFLPPAGFILLAEIDNKLAGMVGLKKLSEGIAEIKRLYVRPAFRGKGLAQALLQQLINEAKSKNYSFIRLESDKFMKNAHQLYHSFGFKDIEQYEGGEAPPEFVPHTIFMELSLANAD
jgi:ribosomal protein S18 acetylase RimI-like enzyme